MKLEDKFCSNNTDIRYCNRKEEKKEVFKKKEINLDKTLTQEKEINSYSFVSNTYIRTDATKSFGRQISTRSGRVEIFIGKELKEVIAKIPNFNLSSFVRQKLIEFLQKEGIEIPKKEPDLIIRVKCPYCQNVFDTSSVKVVRCKYCGRPFRIFRKRGRSRITEIVKGNKYLLWKKAGLLKRI